MPQGSFILVVEDNRADVYLIREAIETTGLKIALQIAADGEEATRLIDQWDADPQLPCPLLVMLDISLPRRTGADVLGHLRISDRCRNTPVLVVSTSDSFQDKQRMMNLGANRYFRKPSEYDEFLKLGNVVREMLDK